MRFVGMTKRGYSIYREKNELIGGFDYYSDALGCGYKVIDSCVSIEELEVILEDMKKQCIKK